MRSLLGLPVIPLAVYFGLIPLTLIAAVFTAATAWTRWRARRPAQGMPLYAYPQPAQPPPIVYALPPAPSAAPTLTCRRCEAPVEIVVDAQTGQPVALQCTRPACHREAPVGPWGAFQEGR